MKIDLNADLGESFGNYKCGMDEEVIKYISSANIACGFHASDPLVMEKTVEMAKVNHVAIGAHPGYPDLSGFGRRNLNVSPQELKTMVQYQLGALMAFCRAKQVELKHVKPHGAMYNMAAKDERLAAAIAEGIAEVDSKLILLGLSGSLLITEGRKAGLVSASEVFADRAYREDGSLVLRVEKGAVITDEEEAISRSLQMAKKGTVLTREGKEIEVKADSICLHGDGEKAVLFAQKLREALLLEGVDIVPLEQVAE